jgi:hypothetical protein
MGSRHGVLVMVLLLAGTTARADIYEWRDSSGARHFTNSMDGVPAAYQANAHVLIADWAHPAVAAAPAAPHPAPVDGPPPEAQVVTEAGGWNDGFEAGVRAAAIELGGGGGAGGTGTVQINGPLAVASVRNSDSAGYPGFYPPWPWYYPFVTTGFDRGRSRHQTLRMLLQDQFQLDRDGPFAYQRWDQPGLGPALAPFLSRGLPNGFSQYGRVIYR